MSHQAIGIYYKFILSDVAFLINYVSERKGKYKKFNAAVRQYYGIWR